jgi:hypothetical protein
LRRRVAKSQSAVKAQHALRTFEYVGADRERAKEQIETKADPFAQLRGNARRPMTRNDDKKVRLDNKSDNRNSLASQTIRQAMFDCDWNIQDQLKYATPTAN